METVEEAPRPMLVDPKAKPKRHRTVANVTPKAPDVKTESPPVTPEPTPPPVLDGKPDHSMVPTPRKKTMPAAEAIAYWNSVPPRERDAWFIAYVYRDLPVCDPLQPLTPDELRQISAKKKKAPPTNCGKLTEPFDVDNWQQQVKDRFGAGEYHVRLNDQHPSIAATVVEFELSGGRDWNSNPPVLEIAEVVLSDPLNEPYIRWAHLKGIHFPGEPGSPETPFDQEEDDDMANVAVVAESNKNLTDRIIEMSKEKTAPAAPAPMEQANTRAVEVIADAATKAQKMMLDGIQAAQQSQTKAQDPMEFHRAVTEAAKAMQPPPAAPSNSNTELLAMMQLMMKQQADTNALIVGQLEKRLESAERRAEAAETRAQTAAHPPAPAVNPEVANPVKNALDLLKGLAALKDSAAGMFGAADPEEGLPVWAKIASKALDTVPGMLHNAAVMYTGHGTPAPPPELSQELVDADTAPAEQPQQPALTEQPQEAEVFSKSKIAQEIAAPLIRSLENQDKGFQFAAGMILTPKIMGFPGRVVYEMAVEEGQDGMIRILQSYPPLWQQLVRIPNRFNTFLSEFFNKEAAYQIAQANAHQTQQPPAPTAAAPEVLPPEQPLNGRAVIDPQTGKKMQTVGKKGGPVVNGPAQTSA